MKPLVYIAIGAALAFAVIYGGAGRLVPAPPQRVTPTPRISPQDIQTSSVFQPIPAEQGMPECAGTPYIHMDPGTQQLVATYEYGDSYLLDQDPCPPPQSRLTPEDCEARPEPDAGDCFDALFSRDEPARDSDRDDADRDDAYDEPDPADFCPRC